VYHATGNDWTLQQTLKPSDASRLTRFGSDVALNASVALVGDAGHAYVVSIPARPTCCLWDSGTLRGVRCRGQSARFQFHFPSAMDSGSFSDKDDIVSFWGPQGVLPATGSWVDSRTLEVSFDPQSADGIYQMVIGPNILNAAGHPMNQDGDGCGG